VKFDTVLTNQKNVIKLIQNSYKKNRLVHTYLFEGAKGTSKLDAAYYFAALILCSEKKKPCLVCDDCKKVMREIHPSIFLIKPDNGIIKKEQVEVLEREFSLTSISEGKRVYIIDGIDKANIYAANSLLKFLEELSGDNYGILITEAIHNVIPTIKSRSQIVSFGELARDTVEEILKSRGVDESTSRILSTITNSPDDALVLISEGRILDLIELVKVVGKAIIIQDKSPLVVFYDESVNVLSDNLKKDHELFLELLITYMFDQLYYTIDGIENIIFKDDILGIEEYLNKDYNRVVSKVETLLKYKHRLKFNINIELFYADLLTDIVR
jgi:DNA polymerase-3 subunit delta'